MKVRATAAATLLLLCGAPRVVRAVDCGSLPNPLYVTGSTAAKPLLAEIGKLLVTGQRAVTLVYSGQGSCGGVDAVLNGTPLRGAGASALSYWDGGGVEQKCDLAQSGVTADLALSDVFAETCFALPGGLPSTLSDFLGPVQTMTFVVPKASTERSISAEAAYYVFGFGSASGVSPWVDENAIVRRDQSSGTQQMIAAAIGVDAVRWRGVGAVSSTDVLTRVTAATAGKGTIGILAADVAQDNRARLTILAYQHYGQTCGYFPDHDATSNEKGSVRDGHYAIWGPLHLLTHVNDSGFPMKADAATVINYMVGSKTDPALDLILLEAQRHVIPQCAMLVRRTREMGPLMSFAPAGACGCYYEKVANGTTSCTPCTTTHDCPMGKGLCSYGYCETQ